MSLVNKAEIKLEITDNRNILVVTKMLTFEQIAMK